MWTLAFSKIENSYHVKSTKKRLPRLRYFFFRDVDHLISYLTRFSFPTSQETHSIKERTGVKKRNTNPCHAPFFSLALFFVSPCQYLASSSDFVLDFVFLSVSC